jgi:hypothetical protein
MARLSMALGLGQPISQTDKIKLAGYSATALLLFVTLIFLVYLAVKAI